MTVSSRQNTLDVVGGLDFALPADTRLNLQLFERTFFNHDPDIIPKRNEPGFSVLLNHQLQRPFRGGDPADLEPRAKRLDVAAAHLLERGPNWRLILGVDVFQGPPLGFFGQYDNRDRVYTEARYSF